MNMNERVLVVDDEKNIADAICYALGKEGFHTDKAYDGNMALEKINTFEPLIVILDLMLPEINGFDICRKLEGKEIGVVMLTAKTNIVDKLLGLELGADDYITKPFDMREVIARVNSLARRLKKSDLPSEQGGSIELNGLMIDLSGRIVNIDGEETEFTSKEFELLYLLLSNPGKVYSRDKLLEIVWNMDYLGGTRTVDTHVQRVRKKLGEKYSNLIATVHGVGYKGVLNGDESRHQV
jgi:two-component system alkaline phosphatase synthesis response regulator PhoP